VTGPFACDQSTRQRGGRHRQRLRKPAPRPLADPGPDEVAMRRREAELTELDRLIGLYLREARWMLARREVGH